MLWNYIRVVWIRCWYLCILYPKQLFEDFHADGQWPFLRTSSTYDSHHRLLPDNFLNQQRGGGRPAIFFFAPPPQLGCLLPLIKTETVQTFLFKLSPPPVALLHHTCFARTIQTTSTMMKIRKVMGGANGPIFRGCLGFCLFFVALWIFIDTRSSLANGGISVEVSVKTTWKGRESPQVDVSVLPERLQTLHEKAKDLPHRFCSSTEKIRPTSGEDREGFYMRYRCQGPKYDEFADELHAFVEQEAPVSATCALYILLAGSEAKEARSRGNSPTRFCTFCTHSFITTNRITTQCGGREASQQMGPF